MIKKMIDDKALKKITLAALTSPLTKYRICMSVEIEIRDYEIWRSDNENSPILHKLDQLILNSFYNWGFQEKIKSQKVQEIYIENELPKSSTGIKLEVINDINLIEKVLQPFDINNERINIQNERDEITQIPD